MKNLLISLFFLSFSAGIFSQEIDIILPDNVEETKADFYFRDVVYKLPVDQPLGEFADESGNMMEVHMGEKPDESIKKYLDKKYPSSSNKTSLIVSVDDLSVGKSESNKGDTYYEATTSLKFYILNGDMLVILGTGNAGVQVKKAADAEDMGKLIAETINQAITNFNVSNWKEHPLLNNKKEKEGKQQQAKNQAAYPEQKTVYTVTPQKKRIPDGDYDWNQINVSLGYSYRLAGIPDFPYQQQEDLIKGLKNGMNFSLSYSNYFGVDWGMGLLFNYTIANSTVNGFPMEDLENNEIYFVDVEETVSTGFFGPAISTRTIPDPDKRLNLIANLGLGYVFYMDEAYLEGIKFEATGSAFGLYLDAALGIDISPSAHLLLKAGYFVAGLSEMEIGGRKYQLYEKENLNRLDINLGVGFNF